jgi:cytochrome c biogenesis protein CcdA
VGPDGVPIVSANRWTAFRHALAYVLGFGAVFTVLGVTATFAAAGLSQWMTQLRVIGGVILVFLGLNLAGVLRVQALERRGGRSTPEPRLRSPARRGRHPSRRPARRRSVTGSAGGSSASAVAGWPRSGSARSSPSAGRRASA